MDRNRPGYRRTTAATRTPTTTAARATGTATSKRRTAAGPFALVLAVAAALAAAGCGASAKHPSQTAASTPTPAPVAGRAAFAWLTPAPAPAGWRRVAIPSGAVLFTPPGWRAVKSDSGTASAALIGAGGSYRGYLNLTPRQSTESLANWATFRVAHNRHENETHEVVQATARGLRFRDGAHGSCIQDAYTTGSGARYVEVACLVAGRRASTVIVGAAVTDAWPQLRPALQQAIAAVQS